MIGANPYIDYRTGAVQYEEVCECFTDEEAEMICRALNAQDDAATKGG
jgi:hypothetical protein